MSLVFLKSRDKQAQEGRHNPNKPYQYSNYLTQPLELPPESQVAYISSSFNIDTDFTLPTNNGFRMLIGHKELDYPLFIRGDPYYKRGDYKTVINNMVTEANEFGLNDMFVNKKEKKDITYLSTVNKGHDYGYNFFYDDVTDKVQLKAIQSTGVDNYNLDFNAVNANPTYNFSGGGTYPIKLNWNGYYNSSEYVLDSRSYVINSPSGNFQFTGGNVGGFVVGQYTNNGNARPNVYSGGANYYNTGYRYNGATQNTKYNFTSTTYGLPAFDKGYYGLNCTSVGIRRVIGDITPSTDPQQSNSGGHQYIGHLNSGGYAIWTQSNIPQNVANIHYTTAEYGATKVGFTGLAPQFVGVQSRTFLESLVALDPSLDGSNFEDNLRFFVENCDLNKGNTPNSATNAFARYLFGFKIYDSGTTGARKLFVRGEILQEEELTGNSLFRSGYKLIGNKALDIEKLSNGINTCVPVGESEITFDGTANYGIQTFDTTAGRTPASLFFRFRWINPYQMCIEYTLSVQGYTGTYNNHTDEPYAPSATSDPTYVPSVEDPATETILLDSSTSGNEYPVTNNTTFHDAGGAGLDYNNNQFDPVTFYAEEGETVVMTVNDITFEHSSTQMYDRLSFEVSNDGITYQTIDLPGFQKPANTSFPYSNSFGGPSYNSSQSYPGFIFPGTSAKFTELGGTLGAPINLGYRYVRFWFTSDSSATEPGWDITLSQSSPLLLSINPSDYDPRDKWCLLATMNLGTEEYFIPTYLGDMLLMNYPIAVSNSADKYRDFLTMHKGYFNPRVTDRSFLTNITGSFGYPSITDTLFFNELIGDTIGVLYRNSSNPVLSSKVFLQEDGATLTNFQYKTSFENTGLYDYLIVGSSPGATKGYCKLLTVELKEDTDLDDFINNKGNIYSGEPLYPLYQPNGLEIGYILGFVKVTDETQIFTGDVELVSKSITFTGVEDVSNSSNIFSLHLQLTNLPVQSSNGVVSSQNKTIQVINSVCINNTYDASSYRFYCDETPRLVWIDLNNAQPITVNKLDIRITDDENIPATFLINDSEVTLQFRKKPATDTSLS